MKKLSVLMIAVMLAAFIAVPASAQSGLPPLCSGVQLQNTSTSASAQVTMDFYKGNTGVPAYNYPVSPDLAPSASKSFYIPSVLPSTVPDGIYSVVVNSSTKLNSLVNENTCSGSTPYVGASHSGVLAEDSGSPLYFPFVLSRAYGTQNWSSALAIQNAGTAAATNVQVQFFPAGSSTSVQTFTNTDLKVGETWYLDLSTGTYATTALSGFSGSAVVTSDQAVAGVANYRPGTNNKILSYNGVKGGGTTLYAPQITKHFAAGDYTSGITIINPNATDTPISVKFVRSGETTPAYTLNTTILANGTYVKYMGSIASTDLADGFNGTVIVEVTSGTNEIIGIANMDSAAGQSGAMNMVPKTQAATVLYLPQIVRAAFGGFESGWQVVNTTGTALNLTIEYWKDDNTLTFTDSKPLPANSALTNYVGGSAFATTIGTNWNGGVVIKVDGAAGGIVGQGNFVAPPSYGGDGLLIYNAFPGN
jgi:hypothetical protein